MLETRRFDINMKEDLLEAWSVSDGPEIKDIRVSKTMRITGAGGWKTEGT